MAWKFELKCCCVARGQPLAEILKGESRVRLGQFERDT